MDKLKPSLLFILICFSINGFSQYNDFDLSKYKLPDLDRRVLETNYNISGSNSYVEEIRSNRYSTHFDLNYNHFQNNQEFQKQSDLRFNFDFISINSKENGNIYYKRNYLTPTLNYQGEYRRYNDKLLFLESDLVLGSQYVHRADFSTQSNGNLEKSSSNTFDFIIFVPFKFGKGRIEPIQDLRHAIYIFQELANIEKMPPDKTEEQIVEFAELISKLKNKRFFDSRIRRIVELASIDSFLISNGHVLNQDIEYFTTLGDYWVYGNRPIRNAGTRISGVIRPGYYFPGLFYDIPIFNENSGVYNLNSLFMLDGGIDFKHEKPINLFWQNTIDFSCYVGIYEGRIVEFPNSEESKIRMPNVNLRYSQSIGYYPNTRTDINLGYTLRYFHMFETELSNDFNVARFATNISLNYYISPKLRINAYSTFYFYWQDSSPIAISLNDVNNEYLLNHFDFGLSGDDITLINDFFHGFQISLIYSIF